MLNDLTLASAAQRVREALAAIDVFALQERLAACAERRALIQATAAKARDRLSDIVREADEAERVGVEKYDERQAGVAFAALLGEIRSARQSGADLVRERDELRLALRGEQAALSGVDAAEQRVKEDARDALGAASAPLLVYVDAELPKRAAELAELHAIAAIAAHAGRTRIHQALVEATSHLRAITGAETPVPTELRDAFADAGDLLALARRPMPDVVHVRCATSDMTIDFRRAA